LRLRSGSFVFRIMPPYREVVGDNIAFSCAASVLVVWRTYLGETHIFSPESTVSTVRTQSALVHDVTCDAALHNVPCDYGIAVHLLSCRHRPWPRSTRIDDGRFRRSERGASQECRSTRHWPRQAEMSSRADSSHRSSPTTCACIRAKEQGVGFHTVTVASTIPDKPEVGWCKNLSIPSTQQITC
jgi:hypothetical protein